MSVRFNEDRQLVAMIQEGLRKKEGFCPCRFERSEDNRCVCKEFRQQLADPDYEGYCHCRLYYKTKGAASLEDVPKSE